MHPFKFTAQSIKGKGFTLPKPDIADHSRPMPPQTPLIVEIPGSSQGSGQKVASPSQTSNWSLILGDDFSVDNLADPNSPWNTGYGWGQTLGTEREYYTRYDKNFNTTCSKGGKNHVYQGSSMSLVAKYEPGSYEVWRWDSNGQFYTTCDPYDFTSGMLCSKQKFLYGQFEIRCKIPFQGQKLFPAFWLFDGGGDAYREIDIFEFEDPANAKLMLMNIHIAQALDFGRVHQEPKRDEPINDYGAKVYLGGNPLSLNPGLDLTNDFHTYAVQWFPNSVTWLVDGSPVRTLAGHSPRLEMHLIVNLAIASWRPAPNPADLPAPMEIDYIKVYKSLRHEFLWAADNGGANKFGLWMMKPDDKYLFGDFDGNGKSEALAFASNGWSHLMKWDGASWQYVWGNNGANKIALWMMKPSDRFVVGDFDGNSRKDLLAFSINGWSHLMKWNGSSWEYAWGNNGANKIAVWQMKPDDKFLAGDFDGDGKSELLALSSNGWAHLMKWNGSDWQYLWGNDGGNKIALWMMKPSDRFVVGDFDGDGKDEVVCIAINGWSHLMKWDGSNWQYVWGNNGAGKIGLWNMRVDDRFVAGDFDGAGRSQLAAFSSTGWSHLMQWDGGQWQYLWGNDGGETIHAWFMKPSDKFYAGAFTGGKAQLFAASVNGWMHIMNFQLLP